MNTWIWLNTLLNGITVNKFIYEDSSLELAVQKFSYPWGEGLFSPYNLEELVNILSMTQQGVNLYWLDNINKNFASKVHTYFRKTYEFNFLKKINKKHVDIIQSLSNLTKVFNNVIVYVHIDFDGLRIIQATPVSYGLKVKWDFKQINLTFDNLSIFIKKIFPKLEPLLAENLKISDLNNLIFNFINLPVVETTNHALLDLFRSIILELLLQALEYTEIPNLPGGLLIVTGELVSLFGLEEYVYLSLLDGLLLKGIWGIWLDKYFVVPNLMYSFNQKMFNVNLIELIPEIDILYADWSTDVPILEVNNQPVKKFIGKVGRITKFKFNKAANVIYSKNILQNTDSEQNYELVFPIAMKIKSIIIDNRPHPVVYGPSPLSNKSRVTSNITDLKYYES